jgi:rRNA maturation RNase YbeY
LDQVINFYYEGITKPDFLDEEKVLNWIIEIVKNYQKEIKTVTYIFCSDDYILKINQDYLNHDTYTDIITFPYQQGELIESDIFISLDRVKENASLLKQDYKNELLRVIIHGILHLCGLKDKSEIDSKAMRKAEEEAIQKF